MEKGDLFPFFVYLDVLRLNPKFSRAFIICLQNKYKLFIDFFVVLWYNILVRMRVTDSFGRRG